MGMNPTMKKIYEFAANLGIKVDIKTNQEVLFYPRNNDDRQMIYHFMKGMEGIQVSYSNDNAEILTDEERKKTIREIGELVKKFGGYLDVDKGYMLKITTNTANRVETLKSAMRKYWNVFVLIDGQRRPLQFSVKNIYSNGEYFEWSEWTGVLAKIEAICLEYKAGFATRDTEVMIVTKSEKIEKVLWSMFRRYDHKKVAVSTDGTITANSKINIIVEENK